jgi:CheY-like chemotaxis protein
VSLPTCPDSQSDSPACSPASTPAGAARVLVVDDELIVRQTARALLEDLGFSVDEAANGEAAIALLRSTPSPFNVILLDATMPGLDAHQTLRGLRGLAPELPILLCSGYSRNDFAEELDTDQHLEFLAKPYRVRELTRIIERMVEHGPS